ncbi:MAG: transglutaminase domain-containing protein, partial [Bacteroidaceae bacterium]|nr:transglutaminase domain-containing protein [Bacteroidaceae bacterium]
MKKCKYSFYALAFSLLLAGCNPIHHEFSGMEQASKDFTERRATISDSTYFSVFTPSLNITQRQALEFLYAYMPLPDIVDYSGEFHLMNVDYALKAREEMPWGKSVPDREF